LLVFWAIAFPAFAQLAKEQPTTIAGIDVEGNVFADEVSVRTLSGLRVGDQINIKGDSKLQTAIKNLWKRGQFSDINILVEKITPAGVFILIKVKEFPRLNEIIVTGNDELSTEDIKSGTERIRGDIMTDYDKYLIKKKLKKLYSDEGLLFAQINLDLVKTEKEQYYNLVIEIEEGVEFHVESIEFQGNKNFSDEDLASEFDETAVRLWWEFWASGKFDLNLYKKDLDILKDFYRKEGYIDAQILGDSLIYDEAEKTVRIIVKVEEGKKVFIRNIEFKGSTIFSPEMLMARLEFEPGDEYNSVLFDQNLQGNEAQSDVSSAYLDNGYLMKRIEKEEIRFKPDSVDIIIRIYEGDRVTIRKVDIVGNTKTKDKVIRRELFTKPGDYFNKSAIIRSVRGLGVMQYFNPETLKPDVKPVETDATKVDLVYNVEERSTDTFNASVGFAGSFGLTGSVGMSFNNFSLSEPLRGGGGQILNFNVEFGAASRMRRFVLGFTEPWLFDEPTTLGFNLFDSRHNLYYPFRQTGVSFNIGRRFRYPDDYFRGDWSVRIQENENQGPSSAYYRSGITKEITLGQIITRSSLNSMFFATSGSRFAFSTYFSLGALGIGTTDYLKNELNFELYNPLLRIKDNDRLVLYLSTKQGFVTGLKSDTAISPIELYNLGGNGLSGYGVTPLRGYPDRSIGVQTGSQLLSKYTAELRFAISVDPMPIYTYLFAEAGNVWPTFKRFDPFELKRSVGFGVLMLINPIGIIGFSYGYGLDYDRSGHKPGWTFLFHLGQ